MKSLPLAALSVAVAASLIFSGSAAVAAQDHPAHAPKPKSAQEQVLAFEKEFSARVVAGDVRAVDKMLAPDFQMTHGDQWTYGETPSAVDDRTAFLARVASMSYGCFEFDNVKTEMHGNVAITYGRYLGTVPMWAGTDKAFFSVWYERVYEKHGHSWTYLSHRTVKGAHYGATAAQALEGMGAPDPALTCS